MNFVTQFQTLFFDSENLFISDTIFNYNLAYLTNSREIVRELRASSAIVIQHLQCVSRHQIGKVEKTLADTIQVIHMGILFNEDGKPN